MNFILPECLIVEKGAFNRIDKILSQYIPGIRNKRVALVTEENLTGIIGKYLDEMKNDMPYSEISLVDANSMDEALELSKNVIALNQEVIIGIGGGKVLDVSKYAAHIAKVPYVCLPTTLSNDSIASPFSVLDVRDQVRRTLKGTTPLAIIVDTQVIASAPASQTKSGIGDTISKYTSLYDYKLDAVHSKKTINSFAYMISDMAFDLILNVENKNIKNNEFIKVLAQALVMGGLAMEISGNSRPCSGAEHLFAHSLEENYPQIKISHGMAVALGAYVATILQGRDIKKIKNILRAYDIDINPKNFEITKKIFTDAWLKASDTRKDRFTILSKKPPKKEDLEAIYEELTH